MRIFVVEDEEKIAQSLKKGLEASGYAVDYALDGETAQRQIEAFRDDYDLIILDLLLPKKDGFEVCRNIRQQNIVTPVLVLTARDATEYKIAALNGGADDYLTKPFSFAELLARIRALLRRPDYSLPDKLKVRDLVLDTITRKAFRNGTEIPLTLKEFSLLEYLIRHPNQVLSREQIINNLWDFTFNALSNIVDAHIKNLRKKIDGNNDEKLLETIRGVGYRIKG